MPSELRVATAQFENRSGDKAFNLATIDELARKAAALGANVVAFHECSITGYSYGLKGRAWLMKWLPARAHDNGVFAVFSNPIGMDDDQLKNGCSMVIDPHGDVLAECRLLGNDIAIATCNHEKLALAGGHRYREAMKPELYRHILGTEHRSKQTVPWMSMPDPKE